jgi:hypothetical protein
MALSAAVLQAVFHFLTLEKRILRGALAQERGWAVLSILEPRVLHAGLGIPWSTAGAFQLSFGGSAAGSPPPAAWSRGPLQIWEGYPSLWNPAPETDGVYRGRGLSVLYAVPSALKAKPEYGDPVEMTAEIPVTVELVPPENRDRITDRLPAALYRNDLRSWVVFPLMRLPVYASSYSGGNLTIRPAADSADLPEFFGALRFYDEMHYLRAERFQVQYGRLYSQELTTSWAAMEERLEGVLEMWFEWTPSKRLLEAWILTAGGESSENGRPGEWPKEAPWRAEFDGLELAVTRGSWILRNM